MSDNLKIKILAPLNTIQINIEGLEDYYYKSIEELLSINEVDFDIAEVGKVQCKMSICDNYVSKKSYQYTSSTALSFEIEIPKKEIEATVYYNETEYKTSSVENYISIVTEDFVVQLKNFLLFLQLAKPGAIKTYKGEVLLNEDYYSDFEGIYSIHQEIYRDIQKIGWPKFKKLEYEEVISWYKTFDFSFMRISNTKTEIALNAFSYLFEYRHDYTLCLFWSLIGIEALYCTGKEGKSEQIFEKTQIILGPIIDFKKKLKQMYNFRSRLIHGDLFIPSYISSNFSLKEIENYNDEFYEATIFSVAILTATLQEMVVLNRSNISFKTILV